MPHAHGMLTPTVMGPPANGAIEDGRPTGVRRACGVRRGRGRGPGKPARARTQAQWRARGAGARFPCGRGRKPRKWARPQAARVTCCARLAPQPGVRVQLASPGAVWRASTRTCAIDGVDRLACRRGASVVFRTHACIRLRAAPLSAQQNHTSAPARRAARPQPRAPAGSSDAPAPAYALELLAARRRRKCMMAGGVGPTTMLW